MTLAIGASLSAYSFANDSFIETLPQVWSSYVESVATSCLEATVDVTIQTQNGNDDRAKWSLNANQPLFLWRVQSPTIHAVRASNHLYAFDVAQKHGESDWKLGGVVLQLPRDLMPNSKTASENPRSEFIAASCRGLAIGSTWFPRVVSDPTFRVVREERSKVDKLWTIDFEYEGFLGNDALRGGRVVLSEDDACQIVSARCKARWPDSDGYISVDNTFSKVDQQSVISHSVYRQGVDAAVLRGKRALVTFDLEYAWRDDDSAIAKNQFFVTHYGFAEPDVPSNVRAWWFALAAVILALLGYLLRRTMTRDASGG